MNTQIVVLRHRFPDRLHYFAPVPRAMRAIALGSNNESLLAAVLHRERRAAMRMNRRMA